jgi:hypothetical protein
MCTYAGYKANLLYQTGINFDFTSSQKSVHGGDGDALNLLNLLMVAKMMSGNSNEHINYMDTRLTKASSMHRHCHSKQRVHHLLNYVLVKIMHSSQSHLNNMICNLHFTIPHKK